MGTDCAPVSEPLFRGVGSTKIMDGVGGGRGQVELLLWWPHAVLAALWEGGRGMRAYSPRKL